MSEEQKTNWTIWEAIIFIVFLPLALIWYVWEKTGWKRQNKWITTVIIAVVFLILLGSSSENTQDKKEASSLEKEQAQEIENLKKQLAQKEEGKSVPQEPMAIPEKEIFRVSHVVDGDTLKLASGEVVRLIGIDAPETVDPERPAQCFGEEASDKIKEMLDGKEVVLEGDVSDKDKYDRILRYVYLDGVFINDYLIRQGFAKADNFPPDEKYKTQFKEAQDEAKNEKRGMWADGACETKPDIEMPVSAPITRSTSAPSTSSSSGSNCNCSKTCPQMSSCAEAQYQLNTCGCSARDADHDGVACDTDCQ